MDDVRTQDRVEDLQGATGTVAAEVSPWPDLTSTRTTAAVLTDDIGFERGKVRDLSERFGDLHHRSRFVEWEVATAARGKAAPGEMLSELSELGFAWRDVARLMGVSVAALQKWRRNESVSGESRRRLASLLAACDLIAEHYAVSEIASWFEMPLLADVPVTPLELYAAGQHKLVFEFASGHVDPERILAEFDPDWRENYRSDYEVFRAGDGERSIRQKDR